MYEFTIFGPPPKISPSPSVLFSEKHGTSKTEFFCILSRYPCEVIPIGNLLNKLEFDFMQ